MTAGKPKGYAPDLFSDHARAAQLGTFVARHLAALGPISKPGAGESLADFERRRSIALGAIVSQAKALCLVPREDRFEVRP